MTDTHPNCPATEQACYDLGYDNPAKSHHEYEWWHLVAVNAYVAGQADHQNQQPRNKTYSREQYDPDTFERIYSLVTEKKD